MPNSLPDRQRSSAGPDSESGQRSKGWSKSCNALLLLILLLSNRHHFSWFSCLSECVCDWARARTGWSVQRTLMTNPRLVALNFASIFCLPLTTSRHTQNIQVANEDAWKSLGKGANNESAPTEGNNQAWNDFVKQEEAKKKRVCYACCPFCRRTC